MKTSTLPSALAAGSFVALVCLLAPNFGSAAEIERVSPSRDLLLYGADQQIDHSCTLRLSGAIAAGDAERLASIAEEYGTREVLCLSGPGGNYVEGIRLALLIHERAILTRVEAGQSCLSACAIAFLGGNYNSASGLGTFVGRYIDVTSRLGFHRPSLLAGEGVYSAAEVERSYNLASAAVRELITASDELSLSIHLIAALLAHGLDSYEYVDTVDELGLYKIGLTGYRRPEIDRGGILAGCWNVYLWKDDIPVSANFATAEEQLAGLSDNWLPVEATANGGRAAFMPGDWEEFCRVSVQVARHEAAWNVPTATFQFAASFQEPADQQYEYPLWAILPASTRISDIPRGADEDLSFRFRRSALISY